MALAEEGIDASRESLHAPGARDYSFGYAGVSKHQIALRTGVVPSTVRETLKRFAAAGLAWPLGDEVTDTVLEGRMYRNAGKKQGYRQYGEPDWAWVHRELKRKHVTLTILWDEYIAQHPDGYRYSRWCDLYRGWEGKLSVTMRQSHAGGEKLFVDYAGDRVEVFDRLTGEARPAGIFVAVMGASSCTYAEATWRQGLADWIGAHTRAFEAMPASHRRYAGWTIERIRRDTAAIGPSTAALCALILEERSHPEQGFRACLGIVRLVKAFGQERVDAAAARALEIGARTYGSVKSILDNNLDRQAAPKRAEDSLAIQHRNIRGSRYYH